MSSLCHLNKDSLDVGELCKVNRFVTWQWPSGGVVLHRPLRRTPSPGPRSLWMQHVDALTTGWQWPSECSKCCKRHHPPGSTKDGNCNGLSLHPAPSSARTQRIKNDKEWQRITRMQLRQLHTMHLHPPGFSHWLWKCIHWPGWEMPRAGVRCTWNENKQNSVLKQWNAKADVPEINPV